MPNMPTCIALDIRNVELAFTIGVSNRSPGFAGAMARNGKTRAATTAGWILCAFALKVARATAVPIANAAAVIPSVMLKVIDSGDPLNVCSSAIDPTYTRAANVLKLRHFILVDACSLAMKPEVWGQVSFIELSKSVHLRL